jgi:uncharacterized protein
MRRNEPAKTLCVSIHDVAPQTWPQCRQLLAAIADVADIPVTLLVVPRYHGVLLRETAGYERELEQRLARGDELALHGYLHLDDGPPPRTLVERFLRQVYTRNEGEFAALDAFEARRRIVQGMKWFAGRSWPVAGFVAPAWLLGAGAWQVLQDFPFLYTTTLRRFHLLRSRLALPSPSLVYAARNAAGRFMSRHRNAWLAYHLRDAPLVRLGLHPADAAYPELLDDSRRLIEQLLQTRKAATKGGFASAFATDCFTNSPPIRPAATTG